MQRVARIAVWQLRAETCLYYLCDGPFKIFRPRASQSLNPAMQIPTERGKFWENVCRICRISPNAVDLQRFVGWPLTKSGVTLNSAPPPWKILLQRDLSSRFFDRSLVVHHCRGLLRDGLQSIWAACTSDAAAAFPMINADDADAARSKVFCHVDTLWPEYLRYCTCTA